MRTFVYLIGSTDEFDSLEDLRNAYFNGPVLGRNMSAFDFDLPASCSDEIAVRVGRGLAFENDWCMDGTLSTLMEA